MSTEIERRLIALQDAIGASPACFKVLHKGHKALATLQEAADELARLRALLADALRAAEPYAEIGLPFVKSDPADNSPWAQTDDAVPVFIGPAGTITVGDLRRAAEVAERIREVLG